MQIFGLARSATDQSTNKHFLYFVSALFSHGRLVQPREWIQIIHPIASTCIALWAAHMVITDCKANSVDESRAPALTVSEFGN